MRLLERAEVKLAVRLAREAGDIIREVAASGFDTQQKDGKGPVTEADRRADQHIKTALIEAYPDDGILTEEGGADSVGRPRVWVVDPLDGTKAFVKQIPGYSVMIGLLQDRQPVLGVVYDPVDDRLFFAAEGQGAWMQESGDEAPRRVYVPEPGSPGDAVFVTTRGAKDEQVAPWLAAGGFTDSIRINSVGIKVGEMLRGRGAVYWSKHGLNYWDTVAPVALALEAGAVVRHVDGSPFGYDFRGQPDDWFHDPAMLIGRQERVDALLRAVGA